MGLKAVRYDDLELLRGLAAVAVVFYHFLRAFLPPVQAPAAADVIGIAVEPPFVLGLVNGPFMVTVFFVLSSFALTVKLVEARSPVTVMIAICKRFPRLFPLTLIGSLLPALLLVAGLMRNKEASALTASTWLRFAGGVKPDGVHQGLGGALLDSVLLFDRGVSQYNSALWTMRYELFGSIIALATALLIAGRRRPLLDILIVSVIAALALKIHALCAICATTVLIVKYLRIYPVQLAPPVALGVLIVGLLMGSTYHPVPEELLINPGPRFYLVRLEWLIHGLGATLVFLGVRCWRRQTSPDWPIARALGRLSFSIYIVHIPIIASVASTITLIFGYNPLSVLAALVATAVAILLVAWPLGEFDQWWVRRLNSIAHRISPRRLSLPGVQPYGTDAP